MTYFIKRIPHKIIKILKGNAFEFFAWTYNIFRQGEIRYTDVPYYNQFGTLTEVDKAIYENQKPSLAYPDWQKMGAKSAEEFDRLAYEICGMTCLAMILEYTQKQYYPPIELFHKAVPYGCYQIHDDGKITGMFHAPFLKFIAQEFNMHGKSLQHVGVNTIARKLTEGNLVMASVHFSIRDEHTRPPKKSGHLVLITGVKYSRFGVDGLYLHNPSGTTPSNQRDHYISERNFKKFFSSNIISIKKNPKG